MALRRSTPYTNMEARFDLRVTGVVMPGLSDGELAKRLAQTYPKLKALFVSAIRSRLSGGIKSRACTQIFCKSRFRCNPWRQKCERSLIRDLPRLPGQGGAPEVD